jgi:hypothetical protein
LAAFFLVAFFLVAFFFVAFFLAGIPAIPPFGPECGRAQAPLFNISGDKGLDILAVA